MAVPSVRLPDGRVHRFAASGAVTGAGLTAPVPAASALPAGATPSRSRVAFAAAHVVADPLADTAPGAPPTLDWDATLAFRRHLWSHGLGVAEAMDTAQRGAGLDYPTTRELIRRSAAEAVASGAAIAAGVATDQLPPGQLVGGDPGLTTITHAYLEQLGDVRAAGAVPVLMCSRQLAATAAHADEYRRVYHQVIAASDVPVILHWLGVAFDPALSGYWGSVDLDEATEAVLDLIKANASRIDGIKVSLLDADREIALRRRLPAGVRMYTGDDFDYPDLIAGDEHGHSDALLGIFDPIAPAAAAALTALEGGDLGRYHQILAPTVPLSRHLFAAPTYHYKTGIVFLAWLAGHQEHFTMVGGLHSGRSAMHLAQALELADAAGLLPDPDLAAARARAFFTVAGVPQPP